MQKIKKFGFLSAVSIISLFLFIPEVCGGNPPLDPSKKADIHRLIKMSGMSTQMNIIWTKKEILLKMQIRFRRFLLLYAGCAKSV
jgi:hypothetical protein